jgi:ABC-type multidrug transport system ATPase subunit
MKLEIQNVSKSYGSKQALKSISFKFENGVTGLLGPNGAGKSTLMQILATVDTPTTGTILYNGVNIIKQPGAIRKDLGYLPQYFGVYPNMTPVEFLEYMAAMKSLNMRSAKKRILELLEVLNLADVRKRQVGGFSGGMMQRVGIAQALLNDPAVLIVDEPTVGLDPEERIQFRNLLSSLSANRIIIFSTHIVTDIESIAPNIALMSKGTLAVFTTPERMVEQVNGKVWGCMVKADDLPKMQNKFIISNAIQRNDGIYVRIISDKQPSINASTIQPSLEDAYLFATAF